MADLSTGIGPVQVLVIAFEDGDFDCKVLNELRRLREQDVIRLIDLLFVAKDEQGDLFEVEESDHSIVEVAEFGALVGALMGLGADGPEGAATGSEARAEIAVQNGSPVDPEGAWFLADAIPAGTAAAVALIEHRWAIPLRDAIESAGGHDLVDRWIHGEDLVAIGAEITGTDCS